MRLVGHTTMTYIYVLHDEVEYEIEGIYTDPDVAITEAKKLILDMDGYQGETSHLDGTSLLVVYKVKIDQRINEFLENWIWESNDMKK